MRRNSTIASALFAATIGATGCWGGTIRIGAAPPPAVVTVEAPPPQSAEVAVVAPAPVVVAAPRRVFVRISGVPSDYPDYVPFYLNGTVTLNAHTTRNGRQGYMLQLVTNDDANAVIAFYKSQMGVPPNAEVNLGAMRILEYAEADHRNKFVVMVSSNGAQTVVQLFAEMDSR